MFTYLSYALLNTYAYFKKKTLTKQKYYNLA